MFYTFAIKFLLHLILLKNYLGTADILVELPNGIIRGREALTTTNKPFYAFQKIPFASPPVGNLRFKPPIPPINWEGILNTTENNVICHQVSTNSENESEDCLYLNVYTPKLPDDEEENNDRLAVMLYIYGGGFVDGGCIFETCGPEFLIDRDVVVVTINYRLGAFGFLSTQDAVIPGNAGLKDQHFAIKWTHDNIQLFGGDPEKITIFGQSAGSASVTYQLLNHKSEGLFRGAICESGSFLDPWSFQRNARQYAFQTAGYLNSSFNNLNNSKSLLDFLINVPADELDKAASLVIASQTINNLQLHQGFYYAPVVEVEHEDAFITERMYMSLKSGHILKIPMLMGFTSEEEISSVNSANFLQLLQSFDTNLDWIVPRDMRIEDDEYRVQIGEKIRQIYTGNDTFFNNPAAGIRFLSDSYFNRGILKHAELQSKFNEAYFYQFSYDGIIGNVSAYIEGAENVTHSEDVRYIFRMRYSSYDNSDLSVFPNSDIVTQYRIQQIWTDFAKTLNPTPEPTELLQNITWPTVGSENEGNFLYVDIDKKLTIKNRPKENTYRKWVELYDSLGYDDFDTY